MVSLKRGRVAFLFLPMTINYNLLLAKELCTVDRAHDISWTLICRCMTAWWESKQWLVAICGTFPLECNSLYLWSTCASAITSLLTSSNAQWQWNDWYLRWRCMQKACLTITIHASVGTVKRQITENNSKRTGTFLFSCIHDKMVWREIVAGKAWID